MKVFNILTDTSGRPLQHQTARFTLRAPGNPFTVLYSEVFQAHAEDTNTSGIWITDMIPNSQFETSGSYYHVDERDGVKTIDGQWDFVVPDTPNPGAVPAGVPAGAWWVRDLLVIPPTPGTPFPPVPPHALGDHTDVDTTGEVAGRVLKFNGTKWVPAVDSGGGGGGSFEHFQDIPANVTHVVHGLGFRPAVSLFTADWSGQYDEFRVTHVDENTFDVTTDTLFRGWVTAS